MHSREPKQREAISELALGTNANAYHTHTHIGISTKNMCAKTSSSVPNNTPIWQKDTTFRLMWIKRLIGSKKRLYPGAQQTSHTACECVCVCVCVIVS